MVCRRHAYNETMRARCGVLSLGVMAVITTACVGQAGVDGRDAGPVRPDGGLPGPDSAGSDGTVSGGPDGSGDAAGATVWRPFADSSPWNTRIPIAAPLDPTSAQLIADFATVPGQDAFWMNIQDFSIPVYWVDSTTTPMVTVTAGLGAQGFRTGAPNEGDVQGSGQAPIPGDAMPAAGTDRHLAIVDRKARLEWGFFNAGKIGAGWAVDVAATQDLSGDGVRPPEHNSPWWAGHGPRACGFGLIAGLITVDEIKAGRIGHALLVAYPHMRSRYYTPPASTAQGTTPDALSTRGIMCGGRIQLDPAVDITTLGLTATGLIIARALQEILRCRR